MHKKFSYFFIYLFVILITTSCTHQQIDKNEQLQSESQNLNSELEMKLNFIVSGEHSMYDLCYDHDTDSCINFFNEAVAKGLMTTSERNISKEENPNFPGRKYHPDFSQNALDIRKTVLNRYFALVKTKSSENQEILSKFKCSEFSCRPNAFLEKDKYNYFIR